MKHPACLQFSPSQLNMRENSMYKSEKSRTKELNLAFLNSKFKVEDFLVPGYLAIAIHSNSTIFYGNDAFCEPWQYDQDEIIGFNA